MVRLPRVVLFLCFIVCLPIASAAAGQSTVRPGCGGDILLVSDRTSSPTIAPERLTALSVDGETIASFAITDVDSITTASDPNRILIRDKSGKMFIADLSTGLSAPVEIPDHDGRGLQVDSVVADSSFVVISSGDNRSLLDLETNESWDISARIGPTYDGFSHAPITSVLVSRGAHLMVVVTGQITLWFGQAQSNDPLIQLGVGGGPETIVFSPSGDLFAYLYPDPSTSLNHIGIMNEHLTNIMTLNFEFERDPLDFRFFDEGHLIVAMKESIIVVDYHTLEMATYLLADVGKLGPSSSNNDRIILWRYTGVSLYDFSAQTLLPLTGFDAFVSANPVVDDRVLLDKLITPGDSIGAIDFEAEPLPTVGHVTNFGSDVSLVGITANQKVAVGVRHAGISWDVIAIDLFGDARTEIAATAVDPTVDLSPTGCIAVTTRQHDNNADQTDVNVYTLEGALVQHVENVVVVGWAPGA